METVETRVLKSSFSGIKGAKKERKLLEESSTSCLGPRDRGFKSRSPDQISTAIMIRNGIVKAVLIFYLKALIYKAFL